MSYAADRRPSGNRYTIERALAPHIDESWAEELILELRLRGVDGARIGAALSEVESHCLDSGEGAREAFGDPAVYAGRLDLPADDVSPRAMLRSLVPQTLQIVGMLLVTWSFASWLDGAAIGVTVGHAATVGVVAAGTLMLVRWMDAGLRLAVRRPALASIALGLTFTATSALGVVALLVLDTVLVRVPAGWGVAVGFAILAVAVAWSIALIRSNQHPHDAITSPYERTTPARTDRMALLVGAAMIPAATVVLLGVSVALHVLAT